MSSRRCGLRLGPSHPVDALHDHLGEGFKAQGGLDVALVTGRPIVLRSTWTSSSGGSAAKLTDFTIKPITGKFAVVRARPTKAEATDR